MLFRSRDGGVSERDQPAVGDGDAMGVARQIGQNGRGTTEWSLGIDDPIRPCAKARETRECVADANVDYEFAVGATDGDKRNSVRGALGARYTW